MQQLYKSISKKEIKISVLIPYCIFVLGGFVNGIVNGNIGTAQQVCLVPMAWIYMAICLVNSTEDAFRIIKVSVLSVIGCFLVLRVGNLMGLAITESLDQYRAVGESIRFGPFVFIFTPIRFATLNALVVPAVLFLLLRCKSYWGNFFYALCLILFIFLIFKASGRGAALGSLVGAILVAMHFFTREKLKVTLIIVGFAFTILVFSGMLGTTLIETLGLEENQSRMIELIERRLQNPNLESRLETLSISIENTIKNPIGDGFTYQWAFYGIDEAIMYSMLLNGTGIIGFVAYTFMLGHLLSHFIKRFRRSISKEQVDLAVVGIATLACGLLAGISSESIVLNEINPFIFWAILAACYGGTCNMNRSSALTNQSLTSPNRPFPDRNIAL